MLHVANITKPSNNVFVHVQYHADQVQSVDPTQCFHTPTLGELETCKDLTAYHNSYFSN